MALEVVTQTLRPIVSTLLLDLAAARPSCVVRCSLPRIYECVAVAAAQARPLICGPRRHALEHSRQPQYCR